MYSVFFKMSEIFSNILFGIAERVFLKEKQPFKDVVKYTLDGLDVGWIFTQTADKYFAEYRGKRLGFRPKFALLTETQTKNLTVLRGRTEPERVYVTWREAASEDFFKDVEQLFKLAKGKSVEPTTSKGG